MTRPIVINSLWGFGDNIYLRPIIQALTQNSIVYTNSPYPELLRDVPRVKFYRTHMQLRTQLKNIERQPKTLWQPVPSSARSFRPSYMFRGHNTLFAELCTHFGYNSRSFKLSLPAYINARWKTNKRIAVIRPVTVRAEWRNLARNPLPEYITEIANMLRHTYHVVCVADIDGRNEALVGKMPFAHDYYVKGELNTIDLLTLVQAASIVVGGPGWIIPAATAANVPGIIVFGGQGGHNAPERLIERDWQHKLQFITPDKFHLCTNMRCPSCPKTISRFSEQAHDCLTKLEVTA